MMADEEEEEEQITNPTATEGVANLDAGLNPL